MKWWNMEPKDVMSSIYWLKDQLPPTGSKGIKVWNNIEKQLIVMYPPPDDYKERSYE